MKFPIKAARARRAAYRAELKFNAARKAEAEKEGSVQCVRMPSLSQPLIHNRKMPVHRREYTPPVVPDGPVEDQFGWENHVRHPAHAAVSTPVYFTAIPRSYFHLSRENSTHIRARAL